jgi:type IV pilus assembly protein PilA
MKNQQRAFTLIEMMVVVAMVGIMATMALPTYHDRVIRTQIEEALALSDIAKQAISEYFERTRRFPRDNRQAMIPPSDKLIGNFVKGIRIQDGAIHVTLGNRVNAHVNSKVITLRPAMVDGSPQSPISWLCGYAQPVSGMTGVGSNKTSVPENYLPFPCRHWRS